MILVAFLTAAAVVVGAIVPALIAQALGWAGYGASFYLVVWLTGAAVAGLVALSQLLIPDRKAADLDQREEAVSVREADVKTREERAAQVDYRITLRMHDITEQSADLDRTRRDLDARTSALYQAEASHKAAAADLAERITFIDMAQAQYAILEARNRLDDERAALRDERAALTGERIALDAAKTVHATQVRDHARAVGKRSASAKRGAVKREGVA
jgi:hypothetical protein